MAKRMPAIPPNDLLERKSKMTFIEFLNELFNEDPDCYINRDNKLFLLETGWMNIRKIERKFKRLIKKIKEEE